MEKALYVICLIAISVVSIGMSVGWFSGPDASATRIDRLEARIMELECRHVRFEDGSTIHGSAERTAECVYTKGK